MNWKQKTMMLREKTMVSNVLTIAMGQEFQHLIDVLSFSQKEKIWTSMTSIEPRRQLFLRHQKLQRLLPHPQQQVSSFDLP